MTIAVVGGGAAGTAAAWHAARRGARVTLFHDRPGATALHSGALDSERWDEGRSAGGLDTDVLAFATAFDVWAVGPSPTILVTDAGVVRTARGADVALLDLSPLEGKRIAVPRATIAGWNGEEVAHAAAASRWARDTSTTFDAVDVEILDGQAPALLPPFDVASYFDDEPSLEALVGRLRAAGRGHDGWLLGPWLGTTVQACETLRRRLGKPCGETTSPPGGPAGARFESSRSQLLSVIGVTERPSRIIAVERVRDAWMLQTEEGRAEGPFRAVVLAIGGVIAGGIVLDGPEAGARGRFRLSVEAPVSLVLDGRLIEAPSTLHDVNFAAGGLGSLERVGICAEDVRVASAPGLLVAGDVVAARPRTVLEAVRLGARAGAAAAA